MLVMSYCSPDRMLQGSLEIHSQKS